MTVNHLARIPVFAHLSERALQGLLDRSRAEVLPAGVVAARQGDPADWLLVVHEGTVGAIHDTIEGRRVRLGTFAAPCAVDKVALLDAGTHTATWETLETTNIRRIARDDILTLVDSVPAVRLHVLRHLAAEARRQQAGRVLASTATASTRVIVWLVEQMATSQTTITLPHGKQQGLAEVLGVSRVTINRSLQRLVEQGLIRLEANGRVRVLSPELLAANPATH